MSVFFVHDPTQRIVTPLDRRYYVRGIPTAQAINSVIPVHEETAPNVENTKVSSQEDPRLAQQRRQMSSAYREHEDSPDDINPTSLKVRDLMSNEVVSIDEDQSIEYLWDTMQTKHISHIAITGDDGFLTGFVSEHDLANFLMAHTPIDTSSTPVSLLCQRSLVSTSADTFVSALVNYLIEHGVDGLPATENGTLVGVVTMTDVLKQVLTNTPDILA
jgi:CBS domain-containing protein